MLQQRKLFFELNYREKCYQENELNDSHFNVKLVLGAR